jgi:hypothetical protein
VGGARNLPPAPGAESRRPSVQLLRRPGDRQQDPRCPHRLGPRAQGRLPAVQGPAGLRPAVSERLRLPGPLDRGRRGEVARPQLEAGDRGVRARQIRGQVSRGRRHLGGAAHPGVEAPRAVDGLGQRLLHLLGHEHRVHLAVSPHRQREGVALYGPSLDRMVSPLRYVALPARADPVGRLPRPRRPLHLRPLPAQGAEG